MRRNFQHYLASAEKQVMQHTMSATGEKNRRFGADGFPGSDRYFTDDQNFGNFQKSSFGNPGFGADGNGAPAAPVFESQPYIITLSNTSAARVANFEFWGAWTYLGNSFSSGSLTISGITISSALPSPATYYFMLQQSNSNPFTVGKTYLRSKSGTTAQVFNNITVQTNDGNGNSASKTLTPVLGTMQYQASVNELNTPYRMDGGTILKMDIEASVVFDMYFYYSYNINIARALGDQSVGAAFAAPHLNPIQPVKAIGG